MSHQMREPLYLMGVCELKQFMTYSDLAFVEFMTLRKIICGIIGNSK